MKPTTSLLSLIGILVLASLPSVQSCRATNVAKLEIVRERDAGPRIQMAAAELRRYLYLRTGRLCKIVDVTAASRDQIALTRDDQLSAEQFGIRTDARGGHQRVRISGGSDLGVLYGAYRWVEKLGVRFYLHGDVIPDEHLTWLPEVNENGKPLFATRGILPFHDFFEGPSTLR